MIRSPYRLSLALLLGALLAPAALHAQTGTDPVRIDVHVNTETTRGDPKATPDPKVRLDAKALRAAPESQGKTLEIAITGKHRDSDSRKGHWTVYGRDAGRGHELMVVESGDFNLELDAQGQQKVESKKVTMTMTPAKPPTITKGKPAGPRPEATGTKYAGYSVVVKDGEKVSGEASDPIGIREEVEKKSEAAKK